MDQQPKIPTLKDAQRPQVKIKGIGAGLTLFERLKQFKKKDLAFILAGLGTLFMAPLAEHFMMAPEGGDAALQQGWGGGAGAGRGNNLFGGGSSPYESGNNSIASGGAIGGSSDIITPLNARDPSALVMGPGAAQQPPAGSAAPATPPPGASRSETDYKDALAGAAGRAASAAVKRAPLPVPKVALGGSGLRGLGAAGSGGTSASASLAPISSGNLGQAGTGGGGLNLVRSAPNFRSVAGPRGPNNPEGLDGTKRAAANAGDAFSRAGSALGGLNAAANEQIPTGGSGFGGSGQGGAGANDKAPGGNGPGGNKSVGESLAFLAMKQRQEEALKLEFEKKKLKDPELLLYGIRNDALKAMANGIVEKALTPFALKWLNKGLGGGAEAGRYTCGAPPDAFDVPLDTPKCGGTQTNQCFNEAGKYVLAGGGSAVPCQKFGGDAEAKPAPASELSPNTPPPPPLTNPVAPPASTTETPVPTAALPAASEIADLNALEDLCMKLKSSIAQGGMTGSDLQTVEKMLNATAKLVAARNALYRGGKNMCTGDYKYLEGAELSKAYSGTPVSTYYHNMVIATIGSGADKGSLGKFEDDVESVEGSNIQDGIGKREQAADAWRRGSYILTEAKYMIPTVADSDFAGLPNPDVQTSALLASAKKSRASLEALVNRDVVLDEEYGHLLFGEMYVAERTPETLKKVIEKNKAFAANREKVAALGVPVAETDLVSSQAPASPQPAEASPSPSSKIPWLSVARDVASRSDAVDFGVLHEKMDLLQKEPEGPEKLAKMDEVKQELQRVYGLLGQMRDAQREFLTALRVGVKNVGQSTAPAATPGVTMTQQTSEVKMTGQTSKATFTRSGGTP